MTQERDSGAHRLGDDDDPQRTTTYTGATTGATGTGDYTTAHEETTTYRERAVPVREEVVSAPTRVRHEEVAVHRGQSVSRDNDRPVNVEVADRQDGVRWGPVWAGLITALTLFLLLELMFYAFGWLDLDPGTNEPGDSRGLVTGILALIAFFIGGLVAGATALWKGLFSGILHGFLVWALGVVAFIALTFFGASALLGSFGDLSSQLGVGPQDVQSATDVSESEENEAQSEAKDAAEPAFWGLLAPLGAAVLGGLVGSKIWPRKRETEQVSVDR